MQLDNKKCGQDMMVVDKTKMLIPVQADDLEHTRDGHSLAVHGIADGTTEDHIKNVFPRAKQVTIARRGGSAFLNYVYRDDCEKDFITREDAEVKGVSVVVMFGHCLKESLRKLDGCGGDLRERLELFRNRESWTPVMHYLELSREMNEDDNKHSTEMFDVLLSSSLRMDRMRKQVTRSKGMEEVMDAKNRWLNRLMTRVIEKSNLPEADVSIYKRGAMRELVEDIWRYFDSSTDDEDSFSGEEEEREDAREKVKESSSERQLSRSSSQRNSSSSSYRRSRRRESSRSSERGSKRWFTKESGRRKVAEKFSTKSKLDQRSSKRGRSRSHRRERSRSGRRGRSWSSRRGSSRSSSKMTFRGEDQTLGDQQHGRPGTGLKININNNLLEKKDRPVLAMETSLVNNNISLGNYLEKKLRGLGLKEDTVVLETDKIMVTVRHGVEDVGKMPSIPHCELMQLLNKFGYKSGHVSERLAADLVVEWACRGKEEAGKVLIVENEEVVNEVEENKDHGIPCEIMGVDEGYPRMALVMAFYLHTERGLEEQISKDLARAMVGVWITYGFTYQQMCEVCLNRDQQVFKVENLRKMLNSKVSEGFVKPMSFGFTKLIKLTLFYFSHAV